MDPEKVNIVFTPDGGGPETILRDDTAACDAGANGWQWGPNHETILLCGYAYARVKAANNANVSVELGSLGEFVE